MRCCSYEETDAAQNVACEKEHAASEDVAICSSDQKAQRIRRGIRRNCAVISNMSPPGNGGHLLNQYVAVALPRSVPRGVNIAAVVGTGQKERPNVEDRIYHRSARRILINRRACLRR